MVTASRVYVRVVVSDGRAGAGGRPAGAATCPEAGQTASGGWLHAIRSAATARRVVGGWCYVGLYGAGGDSGRVAVKCRWGAMGRGDGRVMVVDVMVGVYGLALGWGGLVGLILAGGGGYGQIQQRARARAHS